MATIAHIVQAELSEKPALQEYLKRDLINYAALAESLQPVIEKQLGKQVKVPAIMMAARRYASRLTHSGKVPEKIERSTELIMKTNLVDITVRKSPHLFSKLINLYSLARYEQGDTLNVIHGNFEASIIMNDYHLEKSLSLLAGEKILNVDKDLVSLSLRFGEKFTTTPGIISGVTSKLTFEHINVREVVSTNTELALVVSKKDAMRAYAALEEFTKKKVA